MIPGEKHGHLTAVRDTGLKAVRNAKWLFRCGCGIEKVIIASSVSGGHTRSCGCLRRKNAAVMNASHGLSGSRTYVSWLNMRSRCLNEKNPKYPSYGGRGIKVCKRWKKFKNFLEDMGERPKGLTIDRIDNNAGYTPQNCRWATPQEQANNKNNNVWFEYRGEKLTIPQWSRKCGVNEGTLWSRVRRDDWPIEKAILSKT